jgi:Ribbon-helix-helix protein, copG family
VNSSKPRFLTDLHIRAPAKLAEAVAQAANKNMTTSSEYIRQAILDRLRVDDFLPLDKRVA